MKRELLGTAAAGGGMGHARIMYTRGWIGQGECVPGAEGKFRGAGTAAPGRKRTLADRTCT